MEAWCTAFDACSDHVLYTGADDCKLKAWDLRAGTGMAAWVSVGSHGAGVCTVQPSVHREHVIFTGSYDQHLRVWDVRAPGQPVLAAALDTGGGVWRLKEHPESGDVALTASMHGGFCCVRGLSGTAPAVACVYEQGATCPDAMPDQPALAYGCDWYRGGVGGVGTDEDGWLVATASFYDQEMRIWSAPWK
ncbi:unnamed protein product [Pedinophyceae sp. YPF-701]|nr:unnamed protein product [Pedinophyceae sp. YPF-701]